MIDKSCFKNMSNGEINIEIKNLENEYESCKEKALKLIERMKELDALFIEAKKELNNRSKGIFK